MLFLWSPDLARDSLKPFDLFPGDHPAPADAGAESPLSAIAPEDAPGKTESFGGLWDAVEVH